MRDDEASDAEWMVLLAAGDRAALGELVRRHQDTVLRLAYRFLGRWDAAEDVCQDAFLRVYQSARAYQPTARFTTWLYRIVANLCWDQRRRSARQPVSLDADPCVPAPTAVESSPEPSERRERIRAAIAALPDRQRFALILHRYEELSHKEIGAVTGWSESAVESCLVRAYQALRKSLSDLCEA